MRKHYGYTLTEILIVVAILAITATLALGMIGNTEASLHADRAAREALAAIKYARMMAMTTGGTYGVEFDTTAINASRCFKPPAAMWSRRISWAAAPTWSI